ncbi:glycine-rich domain-containing protein [Pseudomonas wadenswilerensis]
MNASSVVSACTASLLLAGGSVAGAANQTFTSPVESHVLQLPDSVAQITFTLTGAGGGGGVGGSGVVVPLHGENDAGGGGGGSGATLICTLSVIPGSALLVTVGAAGAAGEASANASGAGLAGGASGIRIQEPGGNLSAFRFFAGGGEGGGASIARVFSRDPGRGGSGGGGSTTPDCALAEGYTGSNGVPGNAAQTGGKGAASSLDEAVRLIDLLRGFKKPGSDLSTAHGADAKRATRCAEAAANGRGGFGGVAALGVAGTGGGGCVSIDY